MNNDSINYYNAFLLPEAYDFKTERNSGMTQTFRFDDPEKWYKNIGYVCQGSFKNIIEEANKIFGITPPESEPESEPDCICEKNSDEKVALILVKPEKLYDIYLNNQKISRNELSILF